MEAAYYHLEQDGSLTVSTGRGWTVKVEDFQEGDFGIRFFDLVERPLFWTYGEDGSAYLVEDAAGVRYIQNEGKYETLPEPSGLPVVPTAAPDQRAQLWQAADDRFVTEASMAVELNPASNDGSGFIYQAEEGFSGAGFTEEIGEGHDSYFGGSDFDDTVIFTGGAGAYGKGGLGLDTVAFSGLVSDYLLLGEGDHFTVSNAATGDSFQFSEFEAMRFGGAAAISLVSAIAAFGHQPGDSWAKPEPMSALLSQPIDVLLSAPV